MNAKQQPLVTIGIPTYNRAEEYLSQALKSAVNQTYHNIEIIVSDNCSPDNTEAVVQSFSDPRIRYFKQPENLGANNNFNFCLKKAKGEYFLLLLDDDLIDRDFVEICMNAVNRHTDTGIIRTGTRVIDADGKVINKTLNKAAGLSTEEFIRMWFSWETALYLCSTMFSTKRLREIGGFRSKHNLFQDVLAEFKLAAAYGWIDIMDVKASFRQHSSTKTFAVEVNDWCEDSLFLLDSLCTLVPENKSLVRKKGLKYFSLFNYRLARKIKSPANRFLMYLKLLSIFRFIFLQQIINQSLRRSYLFLPVRLIKRKLGLKNNE